MALTSLFPAQGLQDFVDEITNRMFATSTAGAPAAGTFYSTIVNRASLPDFTKDLKASFGIERIPVNQIYHLQGEHGPNGELVWAAVNDDRGLIRCVGSTWRNLADGAGTRPATQNTITDYMEVTFYGTGLNFVGYWYSATTDWRVSVDGGAEGSNVVSGAANGTAVVSRGNNAHQVIPIVHGLSLGVHTVKIRQNSATASDLNLTGVEIVNANSSSLMNVNSGSGIVQGAKVYNPSAQTIAYNSGVTGTRGGRLVTYLSAAGTLGQAFQPVDVTSGFIGTVSHANEEVARVYSPREFGAARTALDDWSIAVTGAVTARGFTLDDGVTSLVSAAAGFFAANGVEGISASNSNSWQITFVGTGLDFVKQDDSASMATMAVTVDGTSVGSLDGTGVNGRIRTFRVCSGLPYGTHTVRVTYGATNNGGEITKFIVYQPKKPSIPAGAIELSDANIMANYSTNTTPSIDNLSPGTLRRHALRDLVYVDGTGGATNWTASGPNAATVGGWELFSDRGGAYYQFTFFGTGFEARAYRDTGRTTSASVTISANGGAFLAATTANFPTLLSNNIGWSFASGTLNQSGSLSAANGFAVYNLPMNLYTVRVTNNNAGQTLSISSVDVIVPSHAVKSNINLDPQNTLTVGNNTSMDSRKISAIKDSHLQKKNISQAVGVASSPTMTSSAALPMPDMSVVHYNNTGRIKITYSCEISSSILDGNVNIQAYVDGQAVGTIRNMHMEEAAGSDTVMDCIVIPVSPGFHKVDLYWTNQSGGTATAILTRRNLLVEEV